MRILVQHGHTVLGAIKRYRLSRARDLELELLSVRRDLSALRDDYLQLGVQASTLAGERDTAIAARKKTEVYITFLRDNCEVEGEGGQLAADTDQGRSTRQVAQTGTGNGNGQSENTSPGAGWNARDTLKEYFTPRSLLLEAELASLQCELARLGDDYLDLAERTNTIACERDAALIDLNKAQVFVETLVSGLGAAHQNGGQTSDAAADDAVDRLDAVREKLARTQAEKNDLSIKLAESEDRVAELRLQETQLHEELDTLKQCLSDSDKENNAAFRKVQQLADELEKAGIAADGKNQFMAGELRRVHNEYAEIRGKEQRHTEGLEQRFAELELALVAANRTSDGFKQALADASFRQKVKSRHARLPASELDEGSSQREESRNAAQHGKPASTEAAMAGRQASHISWTRSVAGFVFLLGVLASMAKIWDIDSQVIRHAGVGKAIDVGAGERHAAAPRSAGQAPLSETIEIAALDTSEIQPGVVEDEVQQGRIRGKKSGEQKTGVCTEAERYGDCEHRKYWREA